MLLSRPARTVRPYADLVWHTHMLRGADYEAESARMRGKSCGALDHDNGARDSCGAKQKGSPWGTRIALE